MLNWILDFTTVPFSYTLTNVVGCNPHGSPTDQQIEACSPRIDELISNIDFYGIIRLGKIAHNYKTSLPVLNILHPAFISRMEYKLHAVKEQAIKIDRYVDTCKKARAKGKNR